VEKKRSKKRRVGRAPGARVAPVARGGPQVELGLAASAGARVEERGLPTVSDVARVARGPEPPAAKLETALEVLFRAYAQGDPEFAGLLLTGWMRAHHDKHCRLTMAWHREQLRLSLAEILAEGVAQGVFRASLEPGAVAAVILGAAEGCLLQSATEGGAVSAGDVAKAVLRLALNEA
jgi:hypothetical protein